jgi:hypothetical protein
MVMSVGFNNLKLFGQFLCPYVTIGPSRVKKALRTNYEFDLASFSSFYSHLLEKAIFPRKAVVVFSDIVPAILLQLSRLMENSLTHFLASAMHEWLSSNFISFLKLLNQS